MFYYEYAYIINPILVVFSSYIIYLWLDGHYYRNYEMNNQFLRESLEKAEENNTKLAHNYKLQIRIYRLKIHAMESYNRDCGYFQQLFSWSGDYCAYCRALKQRHILCDEALTFLENNKFSKNTFLGPMKRVDHSIRTALMDPNRPVPSDLNKKLEAYSEQVSESSKHKNNKFKEAEDCLKEIENILKDLRAEKNNSEPLKDNSEPKKDNSEAPKREKDNSEPKKGNDQRSGQKKFVKIDRKMTEPWKSKWP